MNVAAIHFFIKASVLSCSVFMHAMYGRHVRFLNGPMEWLQLRCFVMGTMHSSEPRGPE